MRGCVDPKGSHEEPFLLVRSHSGAPANRTGTQFLPSLWNVRQCAVSERFVEFSGFPISGAFLLLTLILN